MTLTQLKTKYKWYYWNNNITDENFPCPKRLKKLPKGLELVKIDRTMTSQEVLDLMKSKGLRPATIYELVLCIPKMEKGYWYPALGTVWKDAAGLHRVPGVGADSDGVFGFSLGYFEHVWNDYGAFFGFRDTKSSESQTIKDDVVSLSLKTINDKLDAIINHIGVKI